MQQPIILQEANMANPDNPAQHQESDPCNDIRDRDRRQKDQPSSGIAPEIDAR